MENKRLGDIATYINGYPFKPEDRGAEGLPIIRIQDLTGNAYDLGFYNGEYPKRIEINDGDVLISWSASLGVYLWDRGKALLNQHIFKVVFDKCAVDKQYFIYAVQHKLKEMESKTHGATMKHIVKKDFDETVIPFPSLGQQAEISKTLSKTANIIAMRQQQLSALDDLIKARFVEMFGDPVINDKNWPTCSISDVIDVRGRVGWKGYKKTDLRDDGPYVIGATHLASDGSIDLSDPVFLSKEKYEESPEIVIKKDDLIIAQRGSIGKVGFVSSDIGEATINPCVLILRPLSINPLFVLHMFLNNSFQNLLCEMSTGNTIPMITQKKVNEMRLIVPDEASIDLFISFVNEVIKSKSVIQKSLDETQLLFDSLMQKYFG